MKIILSPAKKMTTDTAPLEITGMPISIEKTEALLSYLKSLSYPELKKLWNVNDKIASEEFERLKTLDPGRNLAPAILAYDGIAFQYMNPSVFTTDELAYIEEHLRILSGFYGVLKPFDGITPYRLEMQAKVDFNGFKDLYSFWKDDIYKEVRDDSGVILNLASREYSKCVEKYLTEKDNYITCDFVQEENGKFITKGVYAKMARGEMVRFMAENKIENLEDIKAFDRQGYRFRKDLSDEKTYVFMN